MLTRVCAKGDGRWQRTRSNSPHPSCLTTLGILFLSEQGEAWAGLNGPHLSGILNKFEFDMKLTRCSWSCWWQQFSLVLSLYNLSHKAEGYDKLVPELWPSSKPVSAESSSLRGKTGSLLTRQWNPIFDQIELCLAFYPRNPRSCWSNRKFRIRKLLCYLSFYFKSYLFFHRKMGNVENFLKGRGKKSCIIYKHPSHLFSRCCFFFFSRIPVTCDSTHALFVAHISCFPQDASLGLITFLILISPSGFFSAHFLLL